MLKIAVIIIMIISVGSAWQFVPCNDTQKLEEVQALVDQYHFRYQWCEDVFDCADMSVANYLFLKEKGYDPRIAIRRDPPNGSHCYVIFPIGGGWAGLDTQRKNLGNRSLEHCLGKVITDLDSWKICRTPEEVVDVDQSIKEGIRGPYVSDAIEANSESPRSVSNFGY